MPEPIPDDPSPNDEPRTSCESFARRIPQTEQSMRGDPNIDRERQVQLPIPNAALPDDAKKELNEAVFNALADSDRGKDAAAAMNEFTRWRMDLAPDDTMPVIEPIFVGGYGNDGGCDWWRDPIVPSAVDAQREQDIARALEMAAEDLRKQTENEP